MVYIASDHRRSSSSLDVRTRPRAMYKLAAGCLLFLGCLSPVLSLPGLGGADQPLRLPAADGGGRSARDELDRASLLRGLRAVSGVQAADGLREADPGTNTFNPRGTARRAFSGQDPSLLLNRLLARIREHEKRGQPSECFWKYCV